jgi:hypothetical protein
MAVLLLKETKIVALQDNVEALRIANMLAEKLQTAGLSTTVAEVNNDSFNNAIYFTTFGANDPLGKEGYPLAVTNDKKW